MKVHCTFDEMRDLATLVPNPKNYNTHGDKQIELLAKIMNHQGWRNPITVSKRSGFIVAGHGRLMAALKNGWDKAPVDLQDFETEADEYAHLIADNKIAELAKTDELKLGELTCELPDDFDIELTGQLSAELKELKEEVKDAAPDFINVPKIVIEFKEESEMETAFNKLNEQGYSCKIID